MNITNINTMIDTFIRLDKAPLPEHPDKGFNMEDFTFGSRKDLSLHSCGTAACIIGWEVALGICLDLSDDINDALYTPESSNGCEHDFYHNSEAFTLRAAIRVLQILRDTGEVNWNESIANPWTPESDTPAAPSFSTDDWLDAILGNSDGMAVPLLEGPKREESTLNTVRKKEVNDG